MSNINAAQILSLTSCKDINEFFKDFNASHHESRNMTRAAFIALIEKALCIPTPYLGVRGVKKWVITGILAVFLIFGLVGNMLSATIMFRRSRRGLSSYFYLALLAIIDICILYSGCLLFMFEITFNYHPQLHAKIYCQLGFYIQHLFTYISAWLIVAVTFERFIVVRFPFQSIRICRMHIAYTITIIICIFFSLYTAHYFFTLDIIRIDLRTDDGYHPDYYVCDIVDHRHLLAFIDSCFYSVIPSLLIIIFNILIISTMFYAIKQRRNYLQANHFLPTMTTSPRNLNQKTKSLSTIRTQFFRSRSVGEYSQIIIFFSSLLKLIDFFKIIELTPAGRSFIPHSRICNHRLNKNGIQEKSHQILFDSTSATGIRLTCLLLIISFIFVLCTLPISIRLLIAYFVPQYKTTARWQITQLSFRLLMYLNHTVKHEILIYFLIDFYI
jgi:hypothetical protein